MMNVREALSLGRDRLRNSDSPTLAARLLLMLVLEGSHSHLVAHDEEPLSELQELRFRLLVERARLGEPIPYLVGEAPFYGHAFKVSPAVLIPRPETELLVEAALNWAARAGSGQIRLVDVGTGSGCIAITLALHLPRAAIEATDISEAALAVARMNAERHKVLGRVAFHLGPLLAPIGSPPDLIVANLPYIDDHEWTALGDPVKWYEPELALKGGPNGLSLIDQLLAQAKERLAPGGAIFVEIGWQQGARARLLAESHFPDAHVTLHRDYGARDRYVSILT
jgi:release factor glutamine methyltransferase